MLRNIILKKGLVISISLSFLIGSVYPIVGKTNCINESENIFLFNQACSSIDNVSCDHIAYIAGSGFLCWLNKFILNDPSNLTCICENKNSKQGILTGATWTNDWVIISSEYNTGILYKIDPETCNITCIGGGGVKLNGITYNPIKEELYGCTNDNLYKIDIDTGEQEFVGRFSHSVFSMISIACDADGVLYGWDLGNNLWEINKNNAAAILIGPLGIYLHNAQDGHFCMRDDILYITAQTTEPETNYLYECDEDTGNCTLVGQFEDDVDITLFAIPWNLPPHADFDWTSKHPDPEETVLFNASNSYDHDEDIILYEWDWDNDGQFDESYANTTTTHIFEEAGYYPVTLRVQDNYSANDSKTLIVSVGNRPPEVPEIDGPLSGKKETNYSYCITPVDPEGYMVNVKWDWDDGDITDWLGPYESGEKICAIHAWKKTNNYTIKVKVKDEFGAESEWVRLEINIPRTKILHNLLLLRLFEKFKFLYKIFNALGLYN